jgi:cob(I)alamin adenosyltransferase
MSFVARIGTTLEQEGDQSFFASELAWLETELDGLREIVSFPEKFVFFGDNTQTGTLDMARTIVRRAEREANIILDELGVRFENGRQYLNRLSTLCYFLILKNRS